MDADIVRLRIVNKTHCLDVIVAKKERLANAMHTVHNPTVTREDHGMVEVTVMYEPRVLYDIPTGQVGCSFV
jgi:hypothetical protein